MATELLHDRILRLAFLADSSRPAQLSTEDLFWSLEDAHLPLAKIKECLEWLVQRGDMVIDRSKYGLSKTKFFELKAQYAHVAPRGIALWLAPIAPIHVPLPSPPAVATIPLPVSEPPIVVPEALPVEVPPVLAEVTPRSMPEAVATSTTNIVHPQEDVAMPVPSQGGHKAGEMTVRIPGKLRLTIMGTLSTQLSLGALQAALIWLDEPIAIISMLQVVAIVALASCLVYLSQLMRKGHFIVLPNAQDQ